jgi:hypothetical protein
MSTKRRRLNDSTVLIDLTSSVEMCSNTTFASAASMQTIAIAADATELKEEPSKVSTSRYAKKDAKGSMFLGVRPQVALDIQANVYSRLLHRKVFVYTGGYVTSGLTIQLVTAHPCLSRFVCWSAEGHGVVIKESYGKFNNSKYIQIGARKDDSSDESVKVKNIKFLAAKLSLVQRMSLQYTELESMNRETSHLCHSTVGCWRPEHLAAEDHPTNLARNSGVGCAGWFWFSETEQLVCFCSHIPRCEFVRIIPNAKGFGDLSSEAQSTSSSL